MVYCLVEVRIELWAGEIVSLKKCKINQVIFLMHLLGKLDKTKIETSNHYCQNITLIIHQIKIISR